MVQQNLVHGESWGFPHIQAARSIFNVDSTLKFISGLSKYDNMCAHTYKVKKDGEYKILKLSTGLRDVGGINKEWKVLNALKGLEGIPKPERFYDLSYFDISKFYKGFLKEFIEGEETYKDSFEETEEYWEMIRTKLEKIIREIHKAGFSNLDIHTANIVINENDDPFIIDLGLASTRWSLSYLVGKNKDLKRVEIFRPRVYKY